MCRRLFSSSQSLGAAPSWATVDPDTMSAAEPAIGQNLVGGRWMDASETAAAENIVDPLNGDAFMQVPLTSVSEIGPYVERMRNAPRTGLHNPIKNPERYNMLGEVCARAAAELKKPEVLNFFGRLIQRVTPKSWPQATGEPVVVRKFLENYSCDNVRYLAKSFGVPGDRGGQTSCGYRFPFGGVSVITPFNFPLEIPALQCLSALFMGNQVTSKVDSKVMIVQEQFIRMLHEMGLPKDDLDLIYCDGPTMNELLVQGDSRMCLFTGSQAVADKLAVDLKGKIKLEDAGFDWKILGPDGPGKELDFIAWQCDQDAYGFSGQKCSAQSMLFVHDAWETPEVDIVGRIGKLAGKRSLEDLTSCPVLTWNNEQFLAHVDACLKIPGAALEFGGRPYTGHTVPDCYGAFEPTAISVPIESIVGPTADPADFATAITELFGPFQILVRWRDGQLPLVLDALNSMQNHLTAGIVSADVQFINEVLANTISGTTYAGLLARTTAAPQQHWFGPSGDVRAGGIHTKEAIQLCWSSHREIIFDHGPTPEGWAPNQS